jgi:hypothetical protein
MNVRGKFFTPSKFYFTEHQKVCPPHLNDWDKIPLDEIKARISLMPE